MTVAALAAALALASPAGATAGATASAGATAGRQATAAAPSAAVLVVAPTGDDADPGSLDRPLATLQAAVDRAAPGTTIQVRAGTYPLTRTLRILSGGTATAPITLTAYQGEHVVLDGESLPYTPAELGGKIPADSRGVIQLRASWWRIVGLEIAHGPYGLYCDGCSHTVLDRLVTRDNYETGLQIQGSSSDNLVLNLDSHGNHDPRKNGESADGLGIKEGSGTGNVVRGARLWNNVDDGFDAWEFLSPITVEDSISYGNGVNRWDFPDFAGDGNGFKLGGGDTDPAADHVVRNCLAFQNSADGFTDNGNPGALVLDRDTAWRNAGTGIDVAASHSTLTRNLSVGNTTTVAPGVATGSGNSWDLSGSWDGALLSVDPSEVTGPRTASGAIAASDFLRPVVDLDLGARF